MHSPRQLRLCLPGQARAGTSPPEMKRAVWLSWKRAARLAGRGLWLIAELLLAALTYFFWMGRVNSGSPVQRRAGWLQHSSRRALRIFGVRLQTSGPLPQPGLLVCNHLSYLDILLLAALTPCVFVAKNEVKGWPVFGWFARLAGTLFVRRRQRSDVARCLREMQPVLQSGVVLVLFPEGTSSDGRTVLPFKSSLLEPAMSQTRVGIGRVEYELPDGDAGLDVCYWGNMTLVPHVLKLLTRAQVNAALTFVTVPNEASNRKELAEQLREAISKLGCEGGM